MTRNNSRLGLGLVAVGAMGALGALVGMGGAGAVSGVALFLIAQRRGLFGRSRQSGR